MTDQTKKTECRMVGGIADGVTMPIENLIGEVAIPLLQDGRFDSAKYRRSGPAEFTFKEVIRGKPGGLQESADRLASYKFGLIDRIAELEEENRRLIRIIQDAGLATTSIEFGGVAPTSESTIQYEEKGDA